MSTPRIANIDRPLRRADTIVWVPYLFMADTLATIEWTAIESFRADADDETFRFSMDTYLADAAAIDATQAARMKRRFAGYRAQLVAKGLVANG